MSVIFTGATTYWVGIDTSPEATEAELVDFDRFYHEVHVPEVLEANPGMVGVTRFELERPDPRGDFGPRWLAAYQLADQAAADDYIRRNARDSPDRPIYSAGPAAWSTMSLRWRMVWRRTVSLAGADPSSEAPTSVMLIGMNPMAGATQHQVDDFNRFYNETHLGEVLDWGGFDSATRFELHAGLLHPGDGAPRYCAAYETAGPYPGAEGGAAAPAEFSSGPAAWEGRDTLWRLIYRVL